VAVGSSRVEAPAPELRSAPACRDTLERVARALGVPVATFFRAEDQPDTAVVQVADLVCAFGAIASPAARRTCLAFVRAMASF